ncbi:DUF4153 domain-containing protein [Caulobacter sp. 17J65-9]|uniref:DUF4153 domain-containing protein n=1 Tax=Caulobacter sp. 17J65-9 TaxID=2709382 RepID=UPI0013C60FB3|nr:DUF4153 domain-containing protein [Caulobacter sp. 17J65-9]NEX91789.1 DUF4153 domain-containing protein [Caulobacter sp. 17J65-9]
MDTGTDKAGWSGAGWARLAIGLIQGVVLYGLHQAMQAKAWPATEPALFEALVCAWAFTPIVLLGGLGDMRRVTLAVWAVVATALSVVMAMHYVLREGTGTGVQYPHGGAGLFAAAVIFIGHHLVQGADTARRPIAPYPVYFDAAWKHGVQLALAGAFTGVFWLVLLLGAALFKLIGLDFLEKLIREEWFAVPGTTVAFAAAVHLTDVKAGVIRGVRTVALTLLSWLMPLMGLIAVGFLAALPFTGLKLLWATGHAAALVLAAAAVLIILLNAAYQDGEDAKTPTVLKWAGRVTALAVAPLVAIAAYGVWLRVGQYGLTPERVIASACALVGACYAVGYAIAALKPGAWLKPLEATNVATAFVAIGVLIALFTPLADPARIAVADQVRRLEAGKIAPDKFDFGFLRFDGAKWGRAELERLKAHATGPNAKVISEKAAEALKLEYRYQRDEQRPRFDAARITVWPKGRTLPESFVKQAWDAGDGWSPCIQGGDRSCDAFFADLDADGTEEVLLSPGYQLNVYRLTDGRWKKAGDLNAGGCSGVLEALKAGQFKATEPKWKDLEVNGQHLRLQADGCEPMPEVKTAK